MVIRWEKAVLQFKANMCFLDCFRLLSSIDMLIVREQKDSYLFIFNF